MLRTRWVFALVVAVAVSSVLSAADNKYPLFEEYAQRAGKIKVPLCEAINTAMDKCSGVPVSAAITTFDEEEEKPGRLTFRVGLVRPAQEDKPASTWAIKIDAETGEVRSIKECTAVEEEALARIEDLRKAPWQRKPADKKPDRPAVPGSKGTRVAQRSSHIRKVEVPMQVAIEKVQEKYFVMPVHVSLQFPESATWKPNYMIWGVVPAKEGRPAEFLWLSMDADTGEWLSEKYKTLWFECHLMSLARTFKHRVKKDATKEKQ